MHGGLVSLGYLWVKKMSEFFSEVSHAYLSASSNDNGFLNLSDGDKIIYNFKNSEQADTAPGHSGESAVKQSEIESSNRDGRV